MLGARRPGALPAEGIGELTATICDSASIDAPPAGKEHVRSCARPPWENLLFANASRSTMSVLHVHLSFLAHAHGVSYFAVFKMVIEFPVAVQAQGRGIARTGLPPLVYVRPPVCPCSAASCIPAPGVPFLPDCGLLSSTSPVVRPCLALRTWWLFCCAPGLPHDIFPPGVSKIGKPNQRKEKQRTDDCDRDLCAATSLLSRRGKIFPGLGLGRAHLGSTPHTSQLSLW